MLRRLRKLARGTQSEAAAAIAMSAKLPSPRTDSPLKRSIGLRASDQAESTDAPAPNQAAPAPEASEKVVRLHDARTAALSARVSEALTVSEGQGSGRRLAPDAPPAGDGGSPGVAPASALACRADEAHGDSSRAREDDGTAAPVLDLDPAAVEAGRGNAPTPLTSVADLPVGWRLDSVAGPFGVSEALRKEMAVLRLGSSSDVLVVVTSKHFKGPQYQELVQRIKKSRCDVVQDFIADSGLITALYASPGGSDSSGVDSSLARDLDSLVFRALDWNSSDIHINIRQDGTKVQVRRNGRITELTNWSSNYARDMIRAIHAIADADTKATIFSENESQSMMVSRHIGGHLVKLRCQTTPIYPGGMDFVARLLKSGSNAKPIPFDKLGYSRSHNDMLAYMMRAPWGVTIFAGETGSGKSTSLFTMMTDLARSNDGSKLYTVEDPPEYNMERYGISQIPVNAKRGSTENPFTASLRALMRLDPDIAMVGEIRDADSADAVVNLVRSGHKIVTTVHAPGALSILERLLTFGVDIKTMTSRGFIAGLIAQRLAPVLCPHCKVDYSPHLDLRVSGIHDRIRAVTTDGDTLFVAGHGCEKCAHTGIGGQTVLAEMVIPDGKILEHLRNSDFNAAYEYWRSFRQPIIADPNGSMVGMTMLEHGILKMRAGLIAPDELELRCGPLIESVVANEAVVENEVADLLR